MKKLFTLILTLLAFQFVSAQVYLTQDFSGAIWPPIGWSVINQTGNWSRSLTNFAGGTAVGEARFRSTPVFNGNSRLVSSSVNLTGVTHVMVKFRHFVDHNTGSYTLGLSTRSGGAGGVWNNVWVLPVSANIPAQEVIVIVSNSDVGTSNFQLGFFFEGNSANTDFWYIDDIEVTHFTPVNLDAALIAIDVPDLVVGVQPVIGKIINLGNTTLTSLQLKWQLNQGTINTTNLNGLNILTGVQYNFTCDQSISVDPGSYLLKVWISGVNGLPGDDNPANDILQKNISVLTALIQRKPLFEEFTSSTCAPCASFNNSVFNPFINNYGQNICLIKYQMNWPGSGDPYYTAEGGVRRTYYGVNAVPMLYAEGANVATNQTAVMNAYNTAMNSLAFMEISSQHVIDGYNITVKANITPHVSANNARAHIAVVEKITTGNVGSNGETSFKHVMMKMLPDAVGTAVNLVSGVPFELTYSHNMSTTFVEEMSDLAVVVFVQATDKSIFQSAYSLQVASFVTPGDANCDGLINVLDVVTTVSYVLGNNPTPFCFNNADVNSDGMVNVLDVVGIVNIVLGGTKSANIPIKSEPAHFYLTNQGIELVSDGTLAGLQFELSNVNADNLSLALDGYEFSVSEHNGVVKGMIFSFNNTPIPAGKLQLIRFADEVEGLQAGEVIAANVNANNVRVVKYEASNQQAFVENYSATVFPNPTSGDFAVEVFIPATSHTTVRLTDITGRDVMVLHNDILNEGNHRFNVSKTIKLSAGAYFLRIQSTPEGFSDVAFSSNQKLIITD